MPEDKLAVANAFFDATDRRDYRAAMELCHPDVEFDWSRRMLDPVVLRGREEIKRFVSDMFEIFDEIEFAPQEPVLERGEELLAASSARFRGHASGIDVEARAANLWTIRDGKILRFRFYQSVDDALADIEARPVAGEEAGAA